MTLLIIIFTNNNLQMYLTQFWKILCLFNNQINGLFHIASQKISKYELLNLFAKYFNKDIKISPNYDFKIDRSLNNSKFLKKTNYKIQTWNDMIQSLSKTKL